MSYSRRWNQPAGDASARRRGSPGGGAGRKVAVVAASVAIAAVAAFFAVRGMFGSQGRDKGREARPHAGRIAEVEPQKPAAPPERDPLDDPKWDGLDKSRVRKAANGRYVYLPKPGEERFPGERAQALALIGGTNGTAAIDKRLIEDPEHPWMFHNMVQSDLVQYARPGEFAVPINPNITDEQAWEAINTPIGYHYNDTDTQVEEKLFVRDILDDLKEHMQKGGHARDFFAKLHHRQEMEAEIMLTTRQEVHSILNSGDVEGARMALDAYNDLRRQKGLPPMRVRRLNGPKSIPQE